MCPNLGVTICKACSLKVNSAERSCLALSKAKSGLVTMSKGTDAAQMSEMQT